jgi:hypothetical protein
MAESAKKEGNKKGIDKKAAGGKPGGNDLFTEALGVIILILLIFYLLGRFINGFNPANIGSYFTSALANPIFNTVLIDLIIISNIISVLFLVGLVYSIIGYRRFADALEATIKPRKVAPANISVEASKWQKIMEHVGSANPADWRLAILEGDIMLDDLLDKLGVVGDTMGDKLKKINPGDFKSLNNAWEAHRIRNAIAHEGADFALTEREARRVIGLYESVFREFKFI